ncbi:DUF58 domain-containing protein [Halorussus lipolyticus]|uniref:DUF58 domain-containing protein n=1 Tax=Halorussus lipolyticus TaxID=3034024 RepID=UPI0023E87B9D|nr:DUF58 domain-containing protein [Halorussus sp. DT80]
MGVTRRYWGEAGLVVVLAGLSVLFARPLLLVGAAGIAGWLLAGQYAFGRTASAVADELSVTQTLDQNPVTVGDEERVVVTADLLDETPVSLTVMPNPPVGIETTDGGGETEDADSSRRLSLSVGDRTATGTFEVRCPLAGTFEFDPATVTVTDETGRFRTRFRSGSTPSVVVNPREPENLHIGVGGEAVNAPYGEHRSDERGPGIDVAELRAYVPGDALRRIDWKATARLAKPHVREFERETERRTALVVDCRPTMATGSEDGTKFDYARQVALAVVQYARDRNESLRFYPVGNEGLLLTHSNAATAEEYDRIERELRSLDARSRRTRSDGTGTVEFAPADARRFARRMRGDDSAFAVRLRPFFADADPYVERITDDPLYGVARRNLDQSRQAITTVVVTDDSNRAETREAVKLARRREGHTLVFLTPSALFDATDTDPETAYERYADFERFRRDIAALDRVSAFEVGPGDRLETLLTAGEARRRAGTTG